MKDHFGHLHRDEMSCTGTRECLERNLFKWGFLFQESPLQHFRQMNHAHKDTKTHYLVVFVLTHTQILKCANLFTIRRCCSFCDWHLWGGSLHPCFRTQCGRWLKQFVHPCSESVYHQYQRTVVNRWYYWMIQFQSALWLCAHSSWWCSPFRISATLLHPQCTLWSVFFQKKKKTATAKNCQFILFLICDLGGATSWGWSLVPSAQGRVSNLEDWAPDVKNLELEGHKVIS